MPKDTSIKKVLVIGSGPIVIGQAAEFDYAGTQACRVLKQEGVETVLVNSNPATIMTDSAMADEIYIEPLTLETVKRIIRKEKPDSLLLCVEDTGPGIPSALRRTLFERGASSKRRSRGTGLALVREVVEAYHGDIRVESETGVGTSFFLSFRREPLPAPKEEP